MSRLQIHLNNTMTVRELIEHLEEFDGDTKVVKSYPSGDYWKTEIAQGISEGEMKVVEYTDYHRTLKVTDDDEAAEDDETSANVLVL